MFMFVGPNSTVGCTAPTQHWIYVVGTISKTLTPPELGFFCFCFFLSVSEKPLDSLQICSLENMTNLQRDRLTGTIAVKRHEAKQR